MFKKNIVLIIIVLIFFGYIIFQTYINDINGNLYHKNFSRDTFSRLEIEITNNFTDEDLKTKILDKKEILFFYSMFANNIVNNWSKEKRLYDYTILFKFYNRDSTNIYVFDVFFDKEKVPFRPFLLHKKGKNSLPSGYGFDLNDTNYKFYDKVIELWSTRR